MLRKIYDYTDAFHEELDHSDENTSYTKDTERWERLEHTYFPVFCRLAKDCFGRAELSICEQTNSAELLFYSEEFALSARRPAERSAFLDILADADELYLTGGQEEFKLHLQFKLYHEVSTHA